MEPTWTVVARNAHGANVWCTLVMLNDSYACGAVVVAKSLRNVGTKYPIWCMVADGVSPECIDFLQKHFDNVVQVPLITHQCVPMKSKKQRDIYGSWIHASFTKCNIFNPELFPAVDKVCFVDADMSFLENCDDLFHVATPALTFSSPWAYPYVRGGARNAGAPNPFYDKKNHGELKHGQRVPLEKIRRGFQGGVLGLACMVMVSPNEKMYVNMLEILNRKESYGVTNCASGFDEQLFAETILETQCPVYHIHQRYNWYVGKDAWLIHGETPKTQQFYNGKPWLGMSTPEDVAQSPWDDVRMWWAIANEILADDPGAAHWFYQGA